MRFHAIDKLTFLMRQKAITWFHLDMFHGGELTPFRNADPRVLPPPRSLRLWKNVFRIADVFEPRGGCRLVVSERVMRALRDLPNVGFLPVEFGRTFTHPYREFDDSIWDAWPRDTGDIESFLETLPRDPGGATAAGPYFEVVIPRTEDVAPRYAGLHRVEIPIGPTEFDSPIVAELSDELLNSYPITWNMGFILSGRAFDLLAPFVNWNYFVRWDSGRSEGPTRAGGISTTSLKP